MNFDINGFEIIEKIGQGGMASVWKARQLSLDRIVAIKVLSDGFSGEPDDVRRFQDEAQSAAKLKHTGIVQVHDAKAENGIYYFIMEYVSGYTVGDWVRRKGSLSEQDALLVADCVADALAYAWDHANIVHCDIKPDNIIIDEDGTVKVADLGLARTISVMESETELLDEIMGTPAYISPEQAQGETNLDFRSDIYSLGAMLYHLVTGKMMFEESDDDEKLEKHITDTVEDPIDIVPTLSKGICWLIERMTAKDPDLREDSWEAVRADINRVRRGHLPQGKVLPEGASTVCRSVRRTVADYDRINVHRAHHPAHLPTVRTALTTAAIAVAIAAAVRMYIYHSSVDLTAAGVVPVAETNAVAGVNKAGEYFEEPYETETNQPDEPVTAFGESIDSENLRAGEMYDYAVTWFEEHSDDLSAAIDQFKTVVEETRGTKYSLMAQQEIRRLEQLQSEALNEVIADMHKRIKPLVAANEFDKAILIVHKYNGPYMEETAEKRRQVISVLIKKKKKWKEERRRKAGVLELERQRCIDSLIMAILSDDLDLATLKISDMEANEAFADVTDELNEVRKVLDKALNINEKIIKSFESQYGETIDVYLERGMRTLTIRGVSGDYIECRQTLSVGHGAVSTINISVDDLSDYERLRRMGDDSQYDVALVKGIMAFQSNAYSHAEKYFNMTHPLLAKYLLARLRGRERVAGYGRSQAGTGINYGEKAGVVSEPVEEQVDVQGAENDAEPNDIFDREQKRINRRPGDSHRWFDRRSPNADF